MKSKIMFLTAGEIYEGNNLIQSQVINPALTYIKDGYSAEYICVEPALKLFKNKLSEIFKKGKTKTKTAGLPTHFFKSPLQTRKLFSYRYIDVLANSCSKKIIKHLLKKLNLESENKIAFICRSYLAASVALKIKDNTDKQIRDKIKIVFDTRGLLPVEIPITNKKSGIKIYGTLKQWEYNLIDRCDATLVTSKRGLDFLKLETGKNEKISYVPQYGLSIDKDYKYNFEEKWKGRTVAYIGSIGAWHVGGHILKTLDEITNLTGFKAEIVSGSAVHEKLPYPVYSVNHDKIFDVYKKIIAIIVAGNPSNNNYFEKSKLSISWTATKVAEALSAGVPIIVNDQILEHADFVAEHGCGIVYKIADDSGKIDLINCTRADLRKKNFWKNLCANALKAGKIYRQENVYKLQKTIIETLFHKEE